MRKEVETKSDRKIWIKDLSDNHLINIFNAISRQLSSARNSAWSTLFVLRGEMAIESAENACIQLEEMDEYEFVESIAPEIIKELIKRYLITFDQGGEPVWQLKNTNEKEYNLPTPLTPEKS